MTHLLPKLGILAGSGAIPERLVEACRASSRPFFVIAFEGETDPRLVAGVPHLWAGLGAVGRVLEGLRSEGCVEVTLCGKMTRPDIARLKLDWQGIRLMGRLAASLGAGDDAVLRGVIGEIERKGFRVVGVDSLLDDLLTPPGVLGGRAPDEAAQRDIAVGLAAARDLGREDKGQAVVVRGGAVIGREAADGTDALLERLAAAPPPAPSGVLVKMKKPQQERRADLPAIGPETVRGAKRAGLAGIAAEAGESFTIERAAVIREADRLGLFVMGVRAPEEETR